MSQSSTRPSLLEALSRRPLLCDGAMGTQLIAAGLAPGECGERWNVDHPEAVEAIHRRYRDAGCDLLTTNSFGGTAHTLARHALDDRTFELNKAGAIAARRAGGERAYVLGDIGPFGDFLAPVGDFDESQVADFFTAQAAALAAGGVDAFVVETMSDPAEMTLAIRAAKSLHLPVIATYSFNLAGDSFRTMMGATVEQTVKAALEAGADVVGSNCGTGLSLDQYLRLADQLVKAAGTAPVILQPNAGAPRDDNGKLIYDASPKQMADIVPRLLGAGVRIIGGCCGTTPDHLKAMRQSIPLS